MKPKINPGIILRKEKEFGIVFDIDKNTFEYYNDISIEILSLIESGYGLSQIVNILEESYDADKEQIELDLLNFIAEQNEKGVVTWGE